MPKNKNAVIRYRYIDELLSNKYKFLSTSELADEVNRRLVADGYQAVGLRCIQKDLVDLQEELFGAEIIRENINGKECIRYGEEGFSIFTKKLSGDEENLLSEILNTLGQFDGLDNFEWLDSLKNRLNIKEHRRIIQFDSNPYLAKRNLLGSLFTEISNEQVLCLKYHTFHNPIVREVVVHPYLLKEYNNRWFLLVGVEDGSILTFAIDRIDGYVRMPHIEYIKPDAELESRFEDIVGVTLYKDKPIEDILLWVSNEGYPYIATKPLHGSQCEIKGEKRDALSKQYSMLGDGHFVKLDCILNIELEQLLMAKMEQIVVLEPAELKDHISNRVEQLNNAYKSLSGLG